VPDGCPGRNILTAAAEGPAAAAAAAQGY